MSNRNKLKPSAENQRRRIRIRPGEMMSSLEEMELAFREAGPGPIYQRNGKLVCLRPTGGSGGVTDRSSGIEIVPASVDMIAARAEQVCCFEKYRNENWRPCDMPRRLAEVYIALPGGWRLPELKGSASSPTLRLDGSLLCTPGYDPHTGLYLTDTLPVSVPERPSRSQAEQAIGTVKYFFSGVPFAGQEKGDLLPVSVAIAGLIGAILRPVLPTVPGVGITAPAAGTGKSYLVNVIAQIVTGRPVETINVSNRQEEFKKALAAKLFGAPPIVSLDNVEGGLSGDLLAQALSEPVVEDRLLGKSEMLRISPTTAIFATGNNLQIKGDLTRRFLTCLLDSGVEKPEDRTFDRDLLAEARIRRTELMSAALTIAKYGFHLPYASHQRGFPGFQDWYRLVAGPLVDLGLPDPVDSLALARATDIEQEELETLMNAWWVKHGDQVLTCKKVVDTAGLDLEEALKPIASNRAGEPCAQRLGRYLRSIQNRIIGGKRFVRLPKSAQGVRWRLEQVPSLSQ